MHPKRAHVPLIKLAPSTPRPLAPPPIDLSSLYVRLARFGPFGLLTRAPAYLNIAFPDKIAQYWITCTSAGGTLTVDGIALADIRESAYTALTAYGADGLPLSGQSYDAVTDAAPPYVFSSATPMCVLLRIYRKELYRPSFRVRFNDEPLRVPFSLETRFWSRVLNPVIQRLIPPASDENRGEGFRMPSAVKQQGLFPNASAQYIKSLQPTGQWTAMVHYSLPAPTAWRPYIGIMACDRVSTATFAARTLYDCTEGDRYPTQVCLTIGTSASADLRVPAGTDLVVIVRIINVSVQLTDVPLELARYVREGLTPVGVRAVLGANAPQITWVRA